MTLSFSLRPSRRCSFLQSDRFRNSREIARRLCVEPLEVRWLPSTYVVTTTDDSGPGSLRQAILDANAHQGPDTIAFDIAGSGTHTIRPTSALPAVTDTVTIDGTTQPGYSGSPLIVLDGSKAGSVPSGLAIQAENCTVQALEVLDFRMGGVGLMGGGNRVVGCYLGTDATGYPYSGNGFGVVIDGSNNTIGGTTPVERNVISGNGFGVYVRTGTSHSAGNQVLGNYIGPDPSGAKAVGNSVGVYLTTDAENTVGGTTPGSGNLIAGNRDSGLTLNTTLAGAPGTVVQGNLIGTDATGTRALGNKTGVTVGGQNNTVGGTSPAARNLISGNTQEGVLMLGIGSVVQGNYIGTDPTGTAPLGNAIGVSIDPGNTGASPHDMTVGGTVNGAGNLISGNTGAGVSLRFTHDDQILGNTIGTTADGTRPLPNRIGVLLQATNDTVGGSVPGTRNLISGNLDFGVELTGVGTQGNLVQGNLIGTDPGGTTSVRNGYGVYLQSGATGNLIGGLTPLARNVISGNFDGVALFYADGNQVQGNYIGTNAAGTAALGNTISGVDLLAGTGNLIGGTAAGARNLISGNGGNGVAVYASGNQVQGNSIGTNASDTGGLGNALGVYVGGANDSIGGNVAGAGNLISGNSKAGVLLSGPAATGNLVAGNTVLGNGVGVWIDGGMANLIGGTVPEARNVISRNGSDGIRIAGSGNQVQGNYIGTNSTGNVADRNFTNGLAVLAGANGNTIGGTAAGSGNVISGNLGVGLNVAGDDTLIQGNLIGTSANGKAAVPNAGGLSVVGVGNLIGGLTPEARNVISGNEGGGLGVFPAVSGAANLIEGNFIGTDITGTARLANGGGVVVSFGTVIGGTEPGAGNLISGNTQDGLDLDRAGNRVQGNKIGTDVTGTRALGNGRFAVLVSDTSINNLIGGTEPGAGNLISGNAGGVAVSGSGNLLQGNRIGTDVTGTLALGNDGGGVGIGGENNTVGGNVAGAGNLISGNKQIGLSLYSLHSGTVVQGNLIGTDITGTHALGNDTGVRLAQPDTTLGGTGPGDRNVISGNGVGVAISPREGGSPATVQGNYIGTDASGIHALGNQQYGVLVTDNDALIGGTAPGAGNVISGNGDAGIYIVSMFVAQSRGTMIQGNYIGTDATGEQAVGNATGVRLERNAIQTTVGGTAEGAGNLISGNRGDGIQILGNRTDTSGNLIQGNRIGTDSTGIQALGNQGAGIRITGASAVGTAIGGATHAAGNVISGNQGAGISLESLSLGTVIQGNTIGATADGTAALGNGGAGIAVTGSTGNTIGGLTPEQGNLISGNGGNGIELNGDGNLVQGNLVGTDLSGQLPIGNAGNGVYISGSNNTLGGTADGAANRIGFSGLDGVRVDSGTGNALRQNAIFASGGLGIDLVNGGNLEQPAPVLTSAVSGGGVTTVEGDLTSTPSTTFVVEIFVDTVCNPSGFGEGEVFLGSVEVTTDGEGNTHFTFSVGMELDPGLFISATATDPGRNTSGFAGCVVVT
jgi:parallel beta-helix repeat protein